MTLSKRIEQVNNVYGGPREAREHQRHGLDAELNRLSIDSRQQDKVESIDVEGSSIDPVATMIETQDEDTSNPPIQHRRLHLSTRKNYRDV